MYGRMEGWMIWFHLQRGVEDPQIINLSKFDRHPTQIANLEITAGLTMGHLWHVFHGLHSGVAGAPYKSQQSFENKYARNDTGTVWYEDNTSLHVG